MTNTPKPEALEPCPFCGGAARLARAGLDWFVHCEKCFCGTDHMDTPEDARDVWNTRASAVPVENEALASLAERDTISSEKLLQWLNMNWPTGSGSDFNQGVVRGFEIIKAQLERGHIQRYCAATTIATLAAERDALLDLVKGAADIFEHCAVEMGCCCCGDSIETHSIGSGHSPVDQGAYAVDRWQEQYRTTLERTAQP